MTDKPEPASLGRHLSGDAPTDRHSVRHIEWLAPVAAFALLSAFLFRRLLFEGKTLMNLDFPNIHVPFRTFTAAALKSGDFPLWVPGLQFGLPYFANGDTAVLYPFQVPFLLVEPARAIGPLLWMQTVLTMSTMYAFLRLSLGLSRTSSSAGALIFGLNGFFLVHLGLLGLVYAQPWVPLVLLGLERASDGRHAWAILGGLGLAFSFLAGHPQQLFLSALAILILLTTRAIQRRSLRFALHILRACALTVAVGVGLAAVQILPQAELVANSHRRELTFEEATFGAVDQGRVWTILLPDFWGRVSGEVAGWVGVTGLLLAAVGLGALLRKRRLSEAVCWLTIILLSLVLSVGGSTPLYRVFLELWPGLDQFRFPLRFLYPAVLGMSVLASFGFEAIRLRAGPEKARVAVPALGFAVAACAVLTSFFGGAWEARRLLFIASAASLLLVALAYASRRKLARSGVEALVLVALAFELTSVASFMTWNHPSPLEAYDPGPVRSYLEQNPGGRLASVPKGVNLLDTSQTLAAAMGNAALLTDTPSVESFGGQWPPESLEALQEGFVERLRVDDAEMVGRTDLFRLMGVEYVVGDQTQPNLAGAAHLRPVAREDGLTLYRATENGTRVHTYCGARFDENAGRIRRLVLGDGFDPATLWIEGKGTDRAGGPCGRTSIVAEGSNHIELEVSLPARGWVFLADTWYPGWIAEVDGRPRIVHRAQGFFRAIEVPTGDHKVRFSYQPQPFRAGAAVSIATIGSVALILWIGRRRRKIPPRA